MPLACEPGGPPSKRGVSNDTCVLERCQWVMGAEREGDWGCDRGCRACADRLLALGGVCCMAVNALQGGGKVLAAD